MKNETFGQMPGGAPISLYRLNSDSLEAALLSYGATIFSLRVADRSGHFDDVVLNLPDLEAYVQNHRSKAPAFFGSTIGRYANRIGNARFTLEGEQYTLPKNNGAHCLHGGPGGFHNVVWAAQPSENSVEFRYTSKDGEEGFPGNLHTSARFTVSASDLKIEYQASTDKTTILNLTNHAYFNLSGAGRGSILSHELRISASRFVVVDADSIPTGEIRSVSGTALDFRQLTPIGERIHASDEQLRLTRGYDHDFVLDDSSPNLKPAAELYDPVFGRVLEIFTTEPTIQFYSGNYLDGSLRGPGGEPYAQRHGLCLETQHFADSPNHPNFPSTVLRPSETFRSATIYRFSTR